MFVTSDSSTLSPWQQLLLVVLRFLIGWHLFFQGFGKLQAVEWTSAGFLQGSSGPLSLFFHAIADTPLLQTLVDWITVWGLMLFGISLMVGILSRVSAAGGFVLLMLFYLAAPPLSADGFILQTSEGTELYVNKTLLEALFLLVILSFPTEKIAGLDLLLAQWRNRREP